MLLRAEIGLGYKTGNKCSFSVSFVLKTKFVFKLRAYQMMQMCKKHSIAGWVAGDLYLADHRHHSRCAALAAGVTQRWP